MQYREHLLTLSGAFKSHSNQLCYVRQTSKVKVGYKNKNYYSDLLLFLYYRVFQLKLSRSKGLECHQKLNFNIWKRRRGLDILQWFQFLSDIWLFSPQNIWSSNLQLCCGLCRTIWLNYGLHSFQKSFSLVSAIPQ